MFSMERFLSYFFPFVLSFTVYAFFFKKFKQLFKPTSFGEGLIFSPYTDSTSGHLKAKEWELFLRAYEHLLRSLPALFFNMELILKNVNARQ